MSQEPIIGELYKKGRFQTSQYRHKWSDNKIGATQNQRQNCLEMNLSYKIIEKDSKSLITVLQKTGRNKIRYFVNGKETY